MTKRSGSRLIVFTGCAIVVLFLGDRLAKLPAGLERTEFLAYGQSTTEGVITTVAGSNVTLSSTNWGDGGPATNGILGFPQAVAVDNSGSFYIADANGGRIRKVLPNGIIITIAGGGTMTTITNGSPSLGVQLRFPSDVKVDGSGTVYFADPPQHRVFKITNTASNVVLTVVAGTGQAGYSGDGGAATSAQLNSPSTIAVDASGNVYIIDAGNYRIRKVSTNGIIDTVVGTGVAGFSGDRGPAISAKVDFGINSNYSTGMDFDAAGSSPMELFRTARITARR